jgi:hypothetical protein
VRKIIALTTAVVLLGALSACTVSAPSGTCTPTGTAGAASKLVTATGDLGSQPTVDFPTPLITTGLQVSVLEKGDGREIYNSDFVTFSYTQYDSKTGEPLADTASSASYVSDDSDLTALFQCQTVGSRIVATLPSSETDDTTVVLVLDIDKAYTSKATGRIEMPQAGFPSVVTAPDGTPGFTILNEPAPTELEYTTLITGDGEKTKAGDYLLVQASLVDWDTSSSIDTTWGEGGSPTVKQLVNFDATSGSGISSGALKALVGQTVGSQVLVVIPPASYAAGADFTASGTGTVVAVYDILGILTE